MFATRTAEPLFKCLLPAVWLALTGVVLAEFPRFEYHSIAEVGRSMGQTSLVNIDKDGDLDWVVGQSGRMWWFEYVSPDKWIQHDMGSGARTDVGGCAFDIDGDGWIDQASGSAWYRNTGKPRTETFEKFDNGAIRCHDNVAADIDGDGKLDVLACGDLSKQAWTVWYKIPPNPRDKWQQHKIGAGIHGGWALDGSGRHGAGRLCWLVGNRGRGQQASGGGSGARRPCQGDPELQGAKAH